ncbi:MAG TPA: hypothetical protein VFQ39_12460 [Longimicrobium sp.]|nr:hypothetical protein [Longimicrobium sp.]
MRRNPLLLLALILVTPACVSGGPTEKEIVDSLEAQLRSVAGPWSGSSAPLTLSFQLSEGAGNAVSGSGTMKEAAAAGSVPITVTGTYQRPVLSLTISGMVFEGRSVQGTIQGSYTTVAGISGPLHLTATGYARDVTILLQEN